jgi:aminoglycoside/choline kinase family phosphotransferase
LRARGFATPAIHAFHRERGWFILEDLGEVHLQDKALLLKGDPAQLEALYRQVLALLPLMQVKGAEGFDTSKIHSPPYDKTFVRRWESGYFLQFFVNLYCQRTVGENRLADELDALAERLASVDGTFFLYRDFQSKNIMIKHQEVRFLDFQGARKGPLHYDLASLLLDPYVDLTGGLQENLLHYYLRQLRQVMPVDTTNFLNDYYFIAIHRNMQILGAFAFLCMVKGKKHFCPYIPAALKSLKNLLTRAIFSSYSNLKKIVDTL